MATIFFKCYVCRSIVGSIPYCPECEIVLPNGCKYQPRQYFTKAQLKVKEKKEFHKCIVCRKLCAVSPYCSDECRNSVTVKKIKKKLGVRNISVEDADLLNDFENKKASQILSIIHSGINKKKSSRAKYYERRRLNIFKGDGFKCLACGKTEQLTIDHIIPKAKGGSDRRNNLQTLCYECNQRKKTDIVDYRKVVSL